MVELLVRLAGLACAVQPESLPRQAALLVLLGSSWHGMGQTRLAVRCLWREVVLAGVCVEIIFRLALLTSGNRSNALRGVWGRALERCCYTPHSCPEAQLDRAPPWCAVASGPSSACRSAGSWPCSSESTAGHFPETG